MKPIVVACVLALACSGDPDVTKDQGPDGVPGDTGIDTTAEDTGSTEAPPLSGLAWRLHEEMGSLVYVSWTQASAGTLHVEYSFDEGVWLSSPPRAFPAGQSEQLLVGIPFGTAAAWRVVHEGGGSVDGPEILTGPLSESFPVGTVTVSEPDGWLSEGRWLLTSISQAPRGWTGGWYWVYILDRAGRVVWAKRAPDQHWVLFPQIAVTRDHFLWDDATAWSDFDHGAGSVVHKAWLDEEIEVVSTPGLHHAFVQLPDGTLAWGSQAHGGGEALAQLPPGAAEEEIFWTAEEDWPGGCTWFYCESNGLFYVEGTDSLLYSYYTNNSIVEVERSTGTSLWWAGDVRDGYAFDPPDSEFEWQHGLSYTEAGTLLLSSEHQRRTWLLEYEVDHAAETLRLVWSNDSGVKADTNGQAWRLDNGNTLHIVGSAGVIREVGAGDVDVWRVDYGGDYLLGQGEFVADLYTLVKPTE